jgi:hypothetical protein
VKKAISDLTFKAAGAVCQKGVRILMKSIEPYDILSRVGRIALDNMN